MKLTIKHQESYSRGQLLLRYFFGWLYIAIPHVFVLMFIQLWGSILNFIAFWAVLFTAKYPKGMFNYQLNAARWGLRLNASLNNLTDTYPAFGLSSNDENNTIDLPYPEKLSRGLLLLRIFFGGFYVMIPHGFCLFFRLIATSFLMFLAFWAVLFTGKYPESWHKFNVGTLRWSQRINFYYGFMTDKYPPFSGKPYEELNPGAAA